MQLMPETARSLGVTDTNDPDQNINAGTKYLRQQLDTFNGDVPSAVGAYNAGPGAIQKHGLDRVRRFSNFPKGDPRRGGYAGSTGEYIDNITNGYTGSGYHPDLQRQPAQPQQPPPNVQEEMTRIAGQAGDVRASGPPDGPPLNEPAVEPSPTVGPAGEIPAGFAQVTEADDSTSIVPNKPGVVRVPVKEGAQSTDVLRDGLILKGQQRGLDDKGAKAFADEALAQIAGSGGHPGLHGPDGQTPLDDAGLQDLYKHGYADLSIDDPAYDKLIDQHLTEQQNLQEDKQSSAALKHAKRQQQAVAETATLKEAVSTPEKLQDDIRWHFGIGPNTFLSLPANKQRQIALLATQAAAQDETKKAAGQKLEMSHPYQAEMRRHVGLNFNIDPARPLPDLPPTDGLDFGKTAQQLLNLRPLESYSPDYDPKTGKVESKPRSNIHQVSPEQMQSEIDAENAQDEVGRWQGAIDASHPLIAALGQQVPRILGEAQKLAANFIDHPERVAMMAPAAGAVGMLIKKDEPEQAAQFTQGLTSYLNNRAAIWQAIGSYTPAGASLPRKVTKMIADTGIDVAKLTAMSAMGVPLPVAMAGEAFLLNADKPLGDATLEAGKAAALGAAFQYLPAFAKTGAAKIPGAIGRAVLAHPEAAERAIGAAGFGVFAGGETALKGGSASDVAASTLAGGLAGGALAGGGLKRIGEVATQDVPEAVMRAEGLPENVRAAGARMAGREPVIMKKEGSSEYASVFVDPDAANQEGALHQKAKSLARQGDEEGLAEVTAAIRELRDKHIVTPLTTAEAKANVRAHRTVVEVSSIEFDQMMERAGKQSAPGSRTLTDEAVPANRQLEENARRAPSDAVKPGPDAPLSGNDLSIDNDLTAAKPLTDSTSPENKPETKPENVQFTVGGKKRSGTVVPMATEDREYLKASNLDPEKFTLVENDSGDLEYVDNRAINSEPASLAVKTIADLNKGESNADTKRGAAPLAPGEPSGLAAGVGSGDTAGQTAGAAAPEKGKPANQDTVRAAAPADEAKLIVEKSDKSEKLTDSADLPRSDTADKNSKGIDVGSENKPDTAHEFSSTQINLPPDIAAGVKKIASAIPDKDLAGDGREANPHTTVKFGLHTNDVADVKRVLADEPPIKVKIGKLSTFPPSDSSDGAEVLKLDVDSPDLHRLNKKLSDALPHTDTFRYAPHITVGYVKPGVAKKYVGKKHPLQGRETEINSIAFSSKDGKLIEIPLTGVAPVKAVKTVKMAIDNPPLTSDATKVVTNVTKNVDSNLPSYDSESYIPEISTPEKSARPDVAVLKNPTSAKISEWSPRLRAIAQLKSLEDLQGLHDEMVAHRKQHGGDSRLSSLITTVRAELWRARTPALPPAEPEASPAPEKPAPSKRITQTSHEYVSAQLKSLEEGSDPFIATRGAKAEHQYAVKNAARKGRFQEMVGAGEMTPERAAEILKSLGNHVPNYVRKELAIVQGKAYDVIGKKLTGRVGAPKSAPETNSLSIEIRAHGGIKTDPDGDNAGEVRHLKESGPRGLVNETSGQTVESMAMTLAQDGYGVGLWSGLEIGNGLDVGKFLESASEDAAGSAKHYSSAYDPSFEDHPDVAAFDALSADDYGRELLQVVQSGNARASDIAELARHAKEVGLSDEGLAAFLDAVDDTVTDELSRQPQSSEADSGYSLDQDGTLLDPDGEPLFSRSQQLAFTDDTLTAQEAPSERGRLTVPPQHPEMNPRLQRLLTDPSARVRLGAEMAAGSRAPAPRIEDVTAAIDKLSTLRQSKTPVEDYLNQRSLFGNEADLTDVQKALVAAIDDAKQTQLRLFIDSYLHGASVSEAEAASKAKPGEAQGSMFGDQPDKPVADKSEPAPGALADVGEKIGGARKDLAISTGPKGKSGIEANNEPAWRKRFVVAEILAGDQAGRWSVIDTKTKDWGGMARRLPTTFATSEHAEAAIPLAAVSLKHVVYSADKDKFAIYRRVGDRKVVQVVNKQFDAREDAMKYMATHAEEILDTKTSFGEEILPKPETVTRVGVQRRTSDATPAGLKDTFGFRAVEFGNWNNQLERQEVVNHAYDALADLAELLKIPPQAIGLNGELALAFGARGHGLSGARAHYEPNYGVMNLTKMQGAGALAHEWFHSLDHYFGRVSGKASSEKVANKRGDLVYQTSPTFGSDAVTHGFPYKSQARPEIKAAYENLVRTMFKKAERYVEDAAKVEKFLSATREDVRKQLAAIRDTSYNALSKTAEYGNKKAPATAEQLAEFDTIAQKMLDGEFAETSLVMGTTTPEQFRRGMGSTRWSNDGLEGLSAIYKAVRGRSGFSKQGGALTDLSGMLGRYGARLKMLAQAQAGEEKTKTVPTSYAMEAKSIDQGRAGEYWLTPHEMAARAFQAYTEDKLSEQGGQNDFLSYGSHSVVPTPWGWKRPFPHGDERVVINKAFDNLVDTLQTKETEKGTAIFSREAPAGWGAAETSTEAPTWTVDGNQISLDNQNAGRLLPDAYRQLGLKGTDGIHGVFEHNPERLAQALESLAYADPSRSKSAHALAKTVRDAGKNGTVRLGFGAATKQHEGVHEGSYEGSGHKALDTRHTPQGFATLTDNNPQWPTLEAALTSLGYPRIRASLVEEAAAHLMSGNLLGLDREHALDWMEAWYKSFTEANGDLSLERFKELTDDADEARSKVYEKSYAAQAAAAAQESEPGQGLSSVQEGRPSRAGPGTAEDASQLFARGPAGESGRSDASGSGRKTPDASDPWARLADLADEMERPRVADPDLPEGFKARSLPKTLQAAQLEQGENLGYEPASIPDAVDDGRDAVKQLGVDGAIERVLHGEPGIEWASTGFAALEELRAQAAHARSIHDLEAEALLSAKRRQFAGDFAERATKMGQAIVGIKAVEEFAPDRLLYLANKLSKENRKRALSEEEDARIAALGEDLQRERDRAKALELALADVEARVAKRRVGTRSNKPLKFNYQITLDAQAAKAKETLTLNIGKFDFGALAARLRVPTQKGAIGESGGPLPGDAELLAQYAASRLGKVDTVADLNAELVKEFGSEVEPYLSAIRQRAYQIRSDARVAEVEAKDTSPDRRRTILTEIQKEIADARAEAIAWREYIDSGQKAEEKAAAVKGAQETKIYEREQKAVEREVRLATERAEKAAAAMRSRLAQTQARTLKKASAATRAAEEQRFAKEEKQRAQLEAKATRRRESDAKERLAREARARVAEVKREYRAAAKAETKGYRETIKAQQEAARVAGLWDTPIRNAATEARERLATATPDTAETIDDLVSVAAEKLLPPEIGGMVRKRVINPAQLYVELKNEFPTLATKKNQGEVYKRAYQRIEDMTAAAREAARLRSANVESQKVWDEQGMDIDQQAILIQKAGAVRRASEIRQKMLAEFRRVSTAKIWRIWRELRAVPRAIQTSGNMHMGRQGLYTLLTHPIEAGLKAAIPATLRGYGFRWRGWRPGADFSRAAYHQAVAELRQHPDFQLFTQAGGSIAELPDIAADPRLTTEEDELQGGFVQQLPYIRHSTQGFILGQNTERVALFSIYANVGRAEGYTWENNPEFFKERAEFVNDATGRGTMPKAIKQLSRITNEAFYSTRLNVSRVKLLNDLFNPLKYQKYDPVTRKIMIGEVLKMIAALAATFLIAKMLGLHTEFGDADNPDDFRIVWRHTHYDISNGTAADLRFAYRFGRGVAYHLAGRKLASNQEPLMLAGRFARQKLAPLPGAAIDFLLGKDSVGAPANLHVDVHQPMKTLHENIMARLLVPIVFADFAKGFEDDGWLGAAKVAPVLVGFGAQTYAESPFAAAAKIKTSPAHKVGAKELDRLAAVDKAVSINPGRRTDKETDETYGRRVLAGTELAMSAVDKAVASDYYKSLGDDDAKKAELKSVIEKARQQDGRDPEIAHSIKLPGEDKSLRLTKVQYEEFQLQAIDKINQRLATMERHPRYTAASEDQKLSYRTAVINGARSDAEQEFAARLKPDNDKLQVKADRARSHEDDDVVDRAIDRADVKQDRKDSRFVLQPRPKN